MRGEHEQHLAFTTLERKPVRKPISWFLMKITRRQNSARQSASIIVLYMVARIERN